MQMLVEIIKHLWEKPWFSEVLIILFFSLVLLWNKITETERYLRWRVKKAPNDFDAHMNLGMYLSNFDECYEESVAEYQKAHLLNPKHKDPQFQLYLLEKRLNKIDLAEKTLKGLLEDFPEEPFPYMWAGNFYGDTDPVVADQYYCKAISLDKNNSFILQHYGVFLRVQGRYSEAEEYLEKALVMNPTEALIHKNLIFSAVRQSLYSKAEKYSRNFVKAYPKNDDANWLLGIALSNQGNNDEALKIFNKIIKRNPKYEAAYHALGDIYLKIGKLDEAEKVYRAAIIVRPDDIIGMECLGDLLLNSGRYDEALQFYLTAFSIDSKDMGILMPIGNIYRHINKLQDLKHYLEIAKQITSKDNWYDLACIESVGGNSDLGFEYLLKASKLDDFDRQLAWEDPDLQWIRSDPRFLEIVGPKPEKSD